MENRCLLRSVKGSIGVYLYILRGAASVALMRGSASVPMIYRVLPALHLCVVSVAFRLFAGFCRRCTYVWFR